MTTQESSIKGKEKPAKMAWLYLLAAGLVEVAFALSIEPTKGFTRPLQTALCFVLGAGSIYLLTQALKTLPIGTAYAVFTGIGAVGTVVLGIVLAGDPATPGRLVPIALIVAGIVALRLFSAA
jgi:quaternary ammonium compound-resistance protein SugE